MLDEFAISIVNWAEMAQNSIAGGLNVDGLREDVEAPGLSLLPFTPEEAETVGRRWLQTCSCCLSLGDRACLSLGLTFGVPVLTTESDLGDPEFSCDCPCHALTLTWKAQHSRPVEAQATSPSLIDEAN
jgi:PIN domain nuclease of toxin-antitoxin system